MSDYRFRKQFLFGPTPLMSSFSEGWFSCNVGGQVLKCHPDLKVFQSKSDHRNVILMGFAFHCYRPGDNEQNIVDRLASGPSDEDFLNEMDCLCGAFVIIEHRSGQTLFYNDAGSAGKIFYLDDPAQALVGSDPKILNAVTNLELNEDPEAIAFYESRFFANPGGFRKWLGNLTYFKSVFQVLPNHKLNYENIQVSRYFPRAPRVASSRESVIRRSAALLTGLSEAVVQRRTPFVSVTAGWDSRLIMATTHAHAAEATYYTFEATGTKTDTVDVKVAKEICSDLGLNHLTIKAKSGIEQAYINDLEASYELCSIIRYPKFLTLFDGIVSDDRVCMMGNISEIVKNYFEQSPLESGTQYAQAAHFPIMPYTVNYFQGWLDANRNLMESLDYPVADFAHWEQDITNFAGQSLFQLSFVADPVALFNCRELVKIMMESEVKHRDGHNHHLYRGVISTIWPELIKFGVNPTFKNRLIILLKKLGLYRFYKRLQQSS